MVDTITEAVTNPHEADTTQAKAWDDGRTFAGGEEDGRGKHWYMAETAQAAWQAGFDSVAAEQTNTTEFDPTKVDTTSPNIRLEWGTWVTKDGANNGTNDEVVNHFGFYLSWIRDFNTSADAPNNIRPAWADFDVKDRVWREMEMSLVRSMTYTNLRAHNQIGLHVDLPCPPYTYELDGINLRIKSGPYSKAGTKAEFEAFIEELQSEIEDMPEGVDVSDQYLRATGTATIQWSVNIPVTDLLDGDERMNDHMWMGDESDLSEVAGEMFEENSSDYIYTDDLDLTYSGIEDIYISESYVD